MNNFKFSKRAQLLRPKLMIPGPVEVSQPVLDMMGSQAVPDYGDDWVELYQETVNALKLVINTTGDAFLLVSSGSGGVECAINSLFRASERVLVTENGFFGERIAAIAKQNGLDVVLVSSEWGKPVDADLVSRKLKTDPSIAGLIAVHHETSTGVLNPVKEYGRIANEHGIPIIVDAVSSIGGEEYKMDEWGINITVTSSNKCLQGLPGLSPVVVSNDTWKLINKKENVNQGWYLNLRTWKYYSETWSNWHPYPITMAVNNVLALNVALEELFLEGLPNRLVRYRSVANYFRKQLANEGIGLFSESRHLSSTITPVLRFANFDVSSLIQFLLKNYNIRIAGGLGSLSEKIFRVGHMGRAANKEYVDILMTGLKEYIDLNKGINL